MSKEVQHRRNTRANIMSAPPAEGEIVAATDTDRLHLGDGVTNGGIEIPNMGDYQSAGPIAAVAVPAGSDDNPNELAITLDPAPAAWADIGLILVEAFANNTGAVDVAPNGLTPRTVKKNGGVDDLEEGDFVTGGVYPMFNDGTNLQLVGGGAGGRVFKTVTPITSTDATYSIPTAARKPGVIVICVGGGGGSSTSNAGGSGALVSGIYDLTGISIANAQVGAGGGAGGAGSAGNGTTTSFTPSGLPGLSAGGGVGGVNGVSEGSGGAYIYSTTAKGTNPLVLGVVNGSGGSAGVGGPSAIGAYTTANSGGGATANGVSGLAGAAGIIILVY